MLLRAHEADEIMMAGQKNYQEKNARSFQRLLREAEDACGIARLSVVDKPAAPASGNMHDYYSIAPYSWPNPDTPDGLPYINRDGEFNPEFETCDRRRMDKICQVVRTLTLAYCATGDKKYRNHAVRLVRCFFLDEETRVNPHLEFAQAIRGKCTGRGIGIIDLRYFYRMLDMITLLDDEKLTEELRGWMRQLLHWLRNSEKGQDEMHRSNNHGTWYDITCASIALFTGDQRTAEDIFSTFEERRIAPQVQPDGTQPVEIRRTRSFLYSTLNLYGFFIAAHMSEKLGISLWNAQGLRSAFAYMLPYYEDYSKWPHQQIAENWEQTWEQAYEILMLAAKHFQHPEYRAAARSLFEKWIPDSDIVFLRN